MRCRALLALSCGLLALAGLPAQSEAKVFYSRAGAMKLAFPQATRVERRHIYPTADQLATMGKICRCKPPGKLLTVYVGHRDGKTLGYAYIDTHRVRTLPETFMVVLDASGKVQAVHILAFHEPPEYQPPPRWLAQFKGRRGGQDLRVRGGIAGLAGSTLSAYAITGATRRILVIHSVLGLSQKVAAR